MGGCKVHACGNHPHDGCCCHGDGVVKDKSARDIVFQALMVFYFLVCLVVAVGVACFIDWRIALAFILPALMVGFILLGGAEKGDESKVVNDQAKVGGCDGWHIHCALLADVIEELADVKKGLDHVHELVHKVDDARCEGGSASKEPAKSAEKAEENVANDGVQPVVSDTAVGANVAEAQVS